MQIKFAKIVNIKMLECPICKQVPAIGHCGNLFFIVPTTGCDFCDNGEFFARNSDLKLKFHWNKKVQEFNSKSSV